MFGDHSCCWIKLRCIGCGFWVENNRKRNEIGQVCWIEKRTDVRSSFPLFCLCSVLFSVSFRLCWCALVCAVNDGGFAACVHTVSRGGEVGIFCQIFCLKIFLCLAYLFIFYWVLWIVCLWWFYDCNKFFFLVGFCSEFVYLRHRYFL